MTGVFILAIFTRRSNATGALVGACFGTAVPLCVKFTTDVSPYLLGAIGVIVCVLVGYRTSLVVSAGDRDLRGLTIYRR